MEILNRKARHDYFFEEVMEAGIELTGTEIKSIRNGGCSIKDCYGIVKNHEVYLLNMYVAPYKEGNIFNHDETRTRKLLLNKKEIFKLRDTVVLNGNTLVPLKIYFKNNRAKLLLGIAKGKKSYDKRESIKQRDVNRELKKQYKNLNLK